MTRALFVSARERWKQKTSVSWRRDRPRGSSIGIVLAWTIVLFLEYPVQVEGGFPHEVDEPHGLVEIDARQTNKMTYMTARVRYRHGEEHGVFQGSVVRRSIVAVRHTLR
ncbi:hypothetical protein DL546_007491 [Coniochaeta pulveracea]|uniref:Uncharacterized protein n=1 Tax=Coniochaeta pulveracea TaxID=177199 RepID=A0A420YEY3_9PEZI|nr:hypothetical protein DL546_007491 [Coniochaeta pulveracea]